MQHNKINIDDQLRFLEDQASPDVTKMPEHWDQLRKMSQSSKPRVPVLLIRWLAAAAAVITIVIILFPKNKSSIVVKPPAGIAKQIIVTQPEHDSTDRLTQNILPDTTRKNLTFRTTVQVVSRSIHDDIDPPATVTNIVQSPPTVEDQTTLDDFFKQLEKQAQEFVINNRRDTLIDCVDGSTFFIRAGTFAAGNEVRLIIKEYYSYEDIVSNKLTTLSNGELIESGGMIHIYAEENGKEINLAPGRNIRWFLPNKVADMERMQLFTLAGQTTQTKLINERVNNELGRDTARNDPFNWIPQNQFFNNSFVVEQFKVLDLKNTPYKTTGNDGKTKAIFYQDKDSKLSKAALADSLKRKYDYDKVVVRNARTNPGFLGLFNKQRNAPVLGDTVYATRDQVATYKLSVFDTVFYTQNSVAYINNNPVLVSRSSSATLYPNSYGMESRMTILKDRYGVNLNSLGWINCDRFTNDRRIKLNYAVNLNDDEKTYTTMLVFDKMKSVMRGYQQGNQVIFPNVPEGETARVVSVGIRNGKTVSAMANVTISKKVLNNLEFETTSPDEFRKDISKLDE